MSEEKKSVSEVKYQLEYPVKYGERMIEEISFNRPKGKDLRAIGGDPTMDDLLKVASKCSDFSDKFYDELDGVDAIGVTEVIGDFLDRGQETGKTS